ncbi:hypothetical protein FS749_014950 [Ceratobasidium sp. UAMH 11750]|nr:hypothetical protein FS749_014950 [Ceratobasidium sp. UAMH 11750]
MRKTKSLASRVISHQSLAHTSPAAPSSSQPAIAIDYHVPHLTARSDLAVVKQSRKQRRVSTAPSYDLSHLNLARLSLASGVSSTVASSGANTPHDSTCVSSPPDLDSNYGVHGHPDQSSSLEQSARKPADLDISLLLECLDEAALDEKPEEQEPKPIEKQSKRQGKSSNDILKEWSDAHLEGYLDVLFERENLSSDVCITCGNGFKTPDNLDSINESPVDKQNISDSALKCLDCPISHTACSKCCLTEHAYLPGHRIVSWTGSHWKRTSLHDLGYILYLGHNAQSCEVFNSAGGAPVIPKVVEMTIGDTTGFNTVRVGFCMHKEARPYHLQLLKAGIMPCTDAFPKSGFTLTLLELHDLLLYVAKVSTSRINHVLSKLTNTPFPHLTPNRYRELMLCSQKYGHLMDLRHSGAAHIPNKDSQGARDLAVRCPVCPRPGWNYEPDDIIDAEKSRPYFRSYYCFDGNSRNPRKSKADDANDIALSDGRKYFVEQANYLAWINSPASDPPSKRKKPACDHHKAASGVFKNWHGLDVTGIGAITCARHSLFADGGVVNFYRGEL